MVNGQWANGDPHEGPRRPAAPTWTGVEPEIKTWTLWGRSSVAGGERGERRGSRPAPPPSSKKPKHTQVRNIDRRAPPPAVGLFTQAPKPNPGYRF
jgi:hypothetical protein